MILVAGHNAEARRRWQQALRGLVMREASSRRQLEQTIAELKPSVVLLDVALPGLGGAAGVVTVQRLSPASKVILLTASPVEREAIAGFRAGARGYCHQHIEPALLRKAVELVQKGEIWAGRTFISRLVDELSSRTRLGKGASDARSATSLAALTRREREIALLVGAGGANKEIASHLGVTERTVKAHLTAIFRKLGVSDRLRLALLLNGAGPIFRAGALAALAEHPGPGPRSNLRRGPSTE